MGRRRSIFATLAAALGAWGAMCVLGVLGVLVALFTGPLPAQAQPQAAAPPAPARAASLAEDRVALVIGNAAYQLAPLDNPVHDARLIASRLTQAGFKVALRENLDRNGMVAALQEFGAQLTPNTVAVLYYAGHGLQLRDHNFLIPVDAQLRTEADVPLQAMDLSFFLDRMSQARSRVNIVILDACRDNPFAGRTSGSGRQGLAQMDAPVGTLLAFATAPGKQAPDNLGAKTNSIYTEQLAKQLLVPGLPVELMFRRVREAVVRETQRLQVPWEHSSLVGEFAFVPGINATAPAAPAGDDGLAAETAFWTGVQASTRADDFRAYLRQYPGGRFVAIAQQRIAALSAPVAAHPTPADLMPRVGDTWRYRVTDQYRFGDLFVTARVESVDADGIGESWTTTVDGKVRTTHVGLKPAFNPLPDWDAAPPEFAPYLQAAERPAAAIGPQRRTVGAVSLTLKPEWQGEEEVVVTAGRFRAQKLVLSGHSGARGGVSTRYVLWYAPAARRIVKYEVSAQAGRERQSTTFELTEYKLQ
ncbi:MAG: caspase family protein [Ideonella sp.]|nr:caspase family protein [Ideonella sp.]MCC7455491.1 caspase family protein [Nitrospira sp.]